MNANDTRPARPRPVTAALSRRLLSVAASLLLVIALIAACSDSEDDAPPPPDNGGDDVATPVDDEEPTPVPTPTIDPDTENDLAQALLLTVGDFPSGWTEEPNDGSESDSELDEYCPELAGPTLGRTGVAETGTFSGTGFGEASQELALFVDERAATAAIDDIGDLAECLAVMINAGEIDDLEVRAFDASVSPVSFVQVGTRAEAYRISLHIETRDGESADMYFDIVGASTGRVAFSLLAWDIFSPFATHTLEDLATRAADKIEAANIPPFGEEFDLPTPTPTLEPIGVSRSSPAPIGTTVVVGNWEIVVESVTPDATSEVLAANQFNDPPQDGHQFFIATISATYFGGEEESSSFSFDVSLQALGSSAVAYREHEHRCGVIPDELDAYREVFEGGTVSGNICWQIESGDASELVMFAEEMFSFDNGRWWFALYE